jgi:ABC-type amino acid transport substrate-binding protein
MKLGRHWHRHFHWRSRPSRVLPAGAALLLAAALLAGAFPAAASSLAAVKQRGRLVVLSFPHPQSQFIRSDGAGGYEGLDHDLMRAFAHHLGVTLEVRPVASFDRLIPALLAGEGDLVASSYSITTARRERVDFSRPYFPILVMVVAPRGTPLARPDQLAGASACVVRGSSQEERLDALGVERKRYVERSGECWEVVAAGEAGFALFDSTAVATHLASHPGLVRAFHLPGRDEYGLAVVPGSDLRPALDEFLDSVRRSGFLYRLVERHFGAEGAELFQLAREESGTE